MQELIKKVKKIDIKTKRLVDGLLAGAYHSIFKGRGIEFSEVRQYVAGDDIRTIDWNVTARMNEPFVKQFIEERDLTVYILFDISGSNEFGSDKSKKESAIELAASIMFSAVRNNDNIGLGLFTEKVERFLPARKGKRYAFILIREMLDYKPKSKGTNLKEALAYISKIVKKRSIVFILSDFFSQDFERSVKLLKNRHDVIAVNINDLRESEIPDIGYIELEDEETGEQVLVNTSDKEFRENYSKLVVREHEDLKRKFNKLGVDFLQIRSDEPFEIPLKKFFRLRERRAVR